ncbi:MAG: cytochrome c biogenesis protein CcdA, partial [Clostridium sp.]
SSHIMEGVLMLLTYSLGFGIPFILSALLIDSLKSTFNFIKRNYNIINKISGIILIIVGVMMMTGYLNMLLSMLSFV